MGHFQEEGVSNNIYRVSMIQRSFISIHVHAVAKYILVVHEHSQVIVHISFPAVHIGPKVKGHGE